MLEWSFEKSEIFGEAILEEEEKRAFMIVN
jgi:hypothetical protein